MKYNVLIVEDDTLVNDFLVEAVQRAGYDYHSVFSGEEAVAVFAQKSFDIVLTDLKMKAMDGLALTGKLKRINPATVIIMMTAYGTVETAVKAIKLGAYDFLLKPVLPETLEHILSRASEMLQLKSENEILRRDIAVPFYKTWYGKYESNELNLRDDSVDRFGPLYSNDNRCFRNRKRTSCQGYPL